MSSESSCRFMLISHPSVVVIFFCMLLYGMSHLAIDEECEYKLTGNPKQSLARNRYGRRTKEMKLLTSEPGNWLDGSTKKANKACSCHHYLVSHLYSSSSSMFCQRQASFEALDMMRWWWGREAPTNQPKVQWDLQPEMVTRFADYEITALMFPVGV